MTVVFHAKRRPDEKLKCGLPQLHGLCQDSAASEFLRAKWNPLKLEP
jgi:hypothetical protein